MSVLEHPVLESLGWALLHFLWQGILIFLAVRLILAAMRRSSAQAQYVVLCGAMFSMAIWPVATFIYLWPEPTTPIVAFTPAQTMSHIQPAISDVSVAAERTGHEIAGAEPLAVDFTQPVESPTPGSSHSAGAVSAWDRSQRLIHPTLPWLVGGWMIGVCVLSLRLLVVWRQVRRMRCRSTQLAPQVWLDRLAKLSNRMSIRRHVRLVESFLVEVPTVIGWLKPLILLPATAITGLDARQLESLLAHELAHVRRHDYLVNLLQTVLEALLFYQPAVWWVSRQIRHVREVCCDELAVAVCGDHLTYARALATMEELRSGQALTLAANDSSLPSRIRRIVKRPDQAKPAGHTTLIPSGAAVLTLASLCAVALVLYVAPRQTASGNSQPETEKVEDSKSADANATKAEDQGDSDWAAFLAKLRQQESRYQSYSAKVKATRRNSSTSETTSISQQTIHGEKFHFVGEEILAPSAGEPVRGRRQVVFDGRQTLAIEEQNSATLFAGRAEPPQMMPPHCWGMFHLAVNFPLSVYLAGSEALRSHPKVGRHPHEAGSIYEFYKVEAKIVGDETVDGLDCVVVRVKRWYYTRSAPSHQYLWLAKHRNYHVAQTRTAFLRMNREVPRQESRVKKWRRLADDLWLPEVVEVVEISPEAVEKQTTKTVTQRLTLKDSEQNPQLADDFFRLPERPANLPGFELDAKGRMVDSPLHPVPLDPSRTTTLEDILARLSDEEKKYDSCESIVDQRYVFLNRMSAMEGSTLNSQSRQRCVIQGEKRFFEENTSTSGATGKSSWSRRLADDGKVFRTTYADTTRNQTLPQATIDFSRSERRWRGTQDSWLLRLPRDLETVLKSGWLDDRRQHPMKVEYVGDERIGEWTCHKVKCSLTGSYFYLWLARDRNLLPIRHEWHHPSWHAVLPTALHFVDDLREIGPDVWFPRHVVDVVFQKVSRDGLVSSRLVLQWRKDTTVNRMTLHPDIDDQLFSDFVVPKGTQVSVIDELSRNLGQFEHAADGRLEVSSEKLQELKQQAAEKRNPDPGEANNEKKAQRPPSRKRGDSDVGRLLDRLEQLNQGQTLFKDGWLRTIKDLVELGPDAVPKLIEELDATDNDRMLRCLGFILRAIDDKRAVPGLIRAIPKTLRKPGSDMGLTAFDPKLLKFAKQHDLDADDNREHYGFGRPVREICGALEKLTGHQFEEASLYHTFLTGNPPVWREKRKQFYDVAKTWADWWEKDWNKFVDDDTYAKVDLPPLRLSSAPRPGMMIETIGEKSGLILESVFNPDATRVFYDLDSDRFAELPEKWRASGKIDDHLSEILSWAHKQGFDLMGTEYVPPEGGRLVFALQGIDLETWELDSARWKRSWDAVTLDYIREKGRRTKGPLLRHDPENSEKVADPQAKASFLVVTSEGTPALLNVGVEVQDDRQKPGTFFLGDPELNPIGTRKGRRFAVMYFDELEQRP